MRPLPTTCPTPASPAACVGGQALTIMLGQDQGEESSQAEIG